MYSHSRVRTYEKCPYLYYLKYISEEGIEKEENGYGQYGSLVHDIEEKFYKGELKQEELLKEFSIRFYSEVTHPFFTKKAKSEAYDKGVKYFTDYEPFDGEIVGVEERLTGTFAEEEFQGIIDLILKVPSGKRKELHIIDHKTGRVKDVKKQMYIYAELVKQNYGRYPEKMIINSIKENKKFVLDFDSGDLADAEIWAEEILFDIKEDMLHLPKPDYFYCNNICDARQVCEYY